MKKKQIIGLVLVKNEDLYIDRVILNILEFCDQVIVLDNNSSDNTYNILSELALKNSKIDLHKINNLSSSQDYIAEYIGTDTWIFAVDGDEIYDPGGLKKIKKLLYEGEFDNDWLVLGNLFHVISIDWSTKTAKGFLAPPSRGGTKLYNFSMIKKWDECPERLHGGHIEFKKGFSADMRRYLLDEVDWDSSIFRLIHTTFLKRSSKQKSKMINARWNPGEINKINRFKRLISIKNFPKYLFKLFHFIFIRESYKNEHYRRGKVYEKDISVFFR